MAECPVRASCWVNEIVPAQTARVQHIYLEHKPVATEPLTFDAFLEFQNFYNQPGFVAVEIKFSESLDPTPQLKRQYQLAQTLMDSGQYSEGYLVFVAPLLNSHMQAAARTFRAQLALPRTSAVRFINTTLEDVISVIRLSDPAHASLLYNRYSNFARLVDYID